MKGLLLKMLYRKAILIGSRGLNVHTDTYSCDYDFVISLKDYEKYIEKITPVVDGIKSSMKTYFNFVPLGNNSIRRISLVDYKIDILIYENADCVEHIGDIMNDISGIPKYILKNKGLRIQLFEEGIKYYFGDKIIGGEK